MAVVYLDTSVVGRVLLDEPDAAIILRALGSFDHRVASRLLRVELRRVGLRKGLVDAADQFLTGVSLVAIDDGILYAAEAVTPATVGTLDAIHLVTALRLASAGRLDALMTYDAQLAAGAREHGLTVLTPA